MQAPEFWWTDGVLGRLLEPVGLAYAAATRRRVARPPSFTLPFPVICVGNIVAGGAGKTPVALTLAHEFKALGLDPLFLSRGYGGREHGPLQVLPKDHGPDAVGDEPLLLSAVAPTWIGRDRAAAAQAILAALEQDPGQWAPSGRPVLIMDDGHQNPALSKSLSLVVVDGYRGFGNLRCIPAGPLREPVKAGLRRAAAVIVVGPDHGALKRYLPKALPVIHADLQPDPATLALSGRKVVVFAGIGRPERVAAMLQGLGARVVAFHPFADHYPYRDTDIQPILDEAYDLDAVPVTTAKDAVRLPKDQRPQVNVARVTLRWRSPEDHAQLQSLLAPFSRNPPPTDA